MIDTHYIYRPKVLPADAFSKFAADVAHLIAAAPSGVRVRGFDGTGEPTVTDAMIALNGDAATGQEHEPLVIEQAYTGRLREGVGFAFAKTNGKAYDVLVVAILYALVARFPEARFATDSSAAEIQAGFDLFRRVLNLPAADRLFEQPLRR